MNISRRKVESAKAPGVAKSLFGSRWQTYAIAIAACVLASVVGLAEAYWQLGRTPGELMDYTEIRLAGHPSLEAIALPAIAVLRDIFNAPSAQVRRMSAFSVPPPPPLRVADSRDVTSAVPPNHSGGRVVRVGPLERVQTIAEAARVAEDGDIVEIEAGEYHADVATWHQRRLKIRGVGGNARIFANGQSAEGKAIWVIRNGDFDIANIDFVGAVADDLNGAGIRFENGHLRVKNCLFWGGQNGILTSGGARGASLLIENSEFAYNGHGDGLSHNLYVGTIGSLKVTGSYFHHANVGHLIKSRAAVNDIAYNRLTDEVGGRASYELEFPNGGVARVIGNVIQQNPQTENSTLISYGAEGYVWPERRLYLISNTLVNDHPHGGAFLRAAKGADPFVSANNLLVGKGKYHVPGSIESINDLHAGWELFRQASRHDYRLVRHASIPPYDSRQPASASGEALEPKFEYVHPREIRKLPGLPLYPGAFQTVEDSRLGAE